ncbi:hypothetical protein ACFQ3N_02240 [Virgibacillus byunsanensis]|uniref:protein-tyrosine-phosphatase n=1 Tax=Virgibacillus byunsanensis TaxID=570945 RepID=A0ABW3LIH3_9BACI
MQVRKLSYQLLDANLIHFVASGAHTLKKGGLFLREAYREIEKHSGHEIACQLMENSEALLTGQPISKEMPERIKVKKLWSIVL